MRDTVPVTTCDVEAGIRGARWGTRKGLEARERSPFGSGTFHSGYRGWCCPVPPEPSET